MKALVVVVVVLLGVGVYVGGGPALAEGAHGAVVQLAAAVSGKSPAEVEQLVRERTLGDLRTDLSRATAEGDHLARAAEVQRQKVASAEAALDAVRGELRGAERLLSTPLPEFVVAGRVVPREAVTQVRVELAEREADVAEDVAVQRQALELLVAGHGAAIRDLASLQRELTRAAAETTAARGRLRLAEVRREVDALRNRIGVTRASDRMRGLADAADRLDAKAGP